MRTIEPVALGFVCGYELAALVAHSDRLPTISRLVGRLPKLARRCVAAAAGVYLWYHFD